MSIYWIIFIGFMILSWITQHNLKQKFDAYSKVPTSPGLTGREVAERMLRDNGIYNVTVTCTPGALTDHYNPVERTVNLSEPVYNTCSIAAAAVAAHECGHAVQHACAYGPLQMRSALVPIVSFASSWVQWVLLAGMLLIEAFPGIMALGVALFALTTLFSFVTLPVEIDASRRATRWLQTAGITTPANHAMAVSALRSAAYTYVVAALGSLATLLYYASFLLRNDD
ncbi:MAG: zinc metallopeptidase [Alloprevotella sp.]|nr:zinc metallopeptidase [Alloprevotella sp.]